MPSMRVLLVYYSRTGRTKDIALSLKTKLECDVLEIHDTTSRRGFLGYVRSALGAMFDKTTELNIVDHNPADYELVVIGTPVWAQKISVPVRTYLLQMGSKFNKVAFFCSMGGSGYKAMFKHMEDLCGKEPVATLAITEESVTKRTYEEEVSAFAKQINKALDPDPEPAEVTEE